MAINQKRVLMVLYYYQPYVSGVSVCAKRVAEGLVKKGYQVDILTSRHEWDLPREEIINGVRVMRRKVLLKINKGVIMPFFWLDIIRLARKYDYINPHLPLAESGISSLFIPKRKIVTTYQCDINLGDGTVTRVIAWLSMALMKLQLDRSRAVIPSSLDYFKSSKMKAFLPKAVPIYPTVVTDDFHITPSKEFFKSLGVSPNEKRIGFVGRIVYEKGIDYLLRSIPELDKKLDAYRIIIAGDYSKVAGGSTKDQLDEFLEKYPDKILFTGFIDDSDLNAFYSGLDVLVLPSIDPLEAYGMVQVEAMLCGTPVVASNLPGVRQIVKKTGFGEISEIKNSQDIAQKILKVLSTPSKYEPNRKKLIKEFDPQVSFDAYAKLMS